MIITSLLDNDFYKFTMMQGYYELGLGNTIAEYKFVDRNNVTYTKKQYRKIKKEIEKLEDLRFKEDEINYLKGLNIFKEDFLNKLKEFYLPVTETMIISFNNGKIKIRFKGNLPEVSMFEIYVMSIVSEVYCEDQESANLIKGGADLFSKIKTINPKNGFKLVDFGTRRRFSRNWHHHVVHFLKESPFFLGTSNVLLSKEINKKPIGTMAHEWFQIHQGLYSVKESQIKALLNWNKIYPNGMLGVALTDIFNMDVFSKDFTKKEEFSKVYSGLRHDSGDPLEWAQKAMKLFLERSNTLEGKTLVFSDGLSIEKAINIQKELEDENGKLPINVIFGIGTKLTNNVGAKAPNIVIKNIMTNNRPTVKISDEPGKTICEDEDFIKEVKELIKQW